MKNKREVLEELRRYGIRSEDELREAIRNEKPVNISLMVGELAEEGKRAS